SAASFGTLIVADGVTLTLRGTNSSTNAMMQINRYGRFEPEPGAIILMDCASDGACGLTNNGIIDTVGTSDKRVLFSVPSGNYSWNNAATTTWNTTGFTFEPTTYPNVYAKTLNNYWIANAAGNGPASFGDSSLIFSGQAN